MVPPEITDYIIDFLHDDRNTLRNCSLVCREWLISARLHLFNIVRLGDAIHQSYFADFLESVPSVCQYVRSLNVQWYFDGITPKLCQRLFNLTILDLWSDFPDSKALFDLLTCFPSLKRLHLQRCKFPLENMGSTAIPQSVETLSLYMVRFDVSKFMERSTAVDLFCNIRNLDFVPIYPPDTDLLGICTFFKSYGRNLIKLDLIHLSSPFSDEFFDAFGTLVNLQHLVVTYPCCNGRDDSVRRHLNDFKSIPQFFHRIPSCPLNSLTFRVHPVSDFGILPASQNVELESTFIHVWKRVAGILSNPRFASLTKFTLEVERTLFQKEDIYTPLFPLRTRGVLDLRCTPE